jgi:hypothetical protein
MLTKLALMVVLSITFIAASQEPLLPDEVWQIVASHCHDSVGRCINRLFRDNITCTYIDHPIKLNMYGQHTNRFDFLSQAIKENKIKMRGTWIVAECREKSGEFPNYPHHNAAFGFVERMRKQKFLKLHMQIYPGWDACDQDDYCERLQRFIRNNHLLEELSITFDNAQSNVPVWLVPFSLQLRDGNMFKNLKKLSVNITSLGKNAKSDLYDSFGAVECAEHRYLRSSPLEEITLTIEHNIIRLRPVRHIEDMDWFEFVCKVKMGTVKSAKAKAPWYWSGDPTKRT